MKPISTVAGAKHARMITALAMTWFSLITIVLAVSSASGAVLATSPAAGDPVRGKELFDKRCGGCHSLDSDKEGPRLRGVYGRPVGTVSTFKYSDAMKSARFTWDASSLDRWLTNTETVVPDNDMDFHVPKADERADVIEFLRASSKP